MEKREEQLNSNIPIYVREVLRLLNEAGHEAFIVGGCVRDILMGRQPSDWDVCTSALPSETTVCFGAANTVQTGVKHGTVTVLTEEKPVEITTYRIDGDYRDGRHPEAVVFTPSLAEDLKRRDFTMNAIAYHPQRKLVDLYGSMKDIQCQLIRCVGEPQKRFEEDALRILRALRFRAVLGFKLEMETAKAVRACAPLLTQISKERINAELSKLVLGKEADSVIDGYAEVLQICCPKLVPASVKNLPPALSVRLAVLFPADTKKALRELKYDHRTVEQASDIAKLCAEKKAPSGERSAILRLLRQYGEETSFLYYSIFGREAEVKDAIADGACWSLQQLVVSGGDLIKLGAVPGPAIGSILDEMLELVIEGKLENSSGSLLDYARERVVL